MSLTLFRPRRRPPVAGLAFAAIGLALAAVALAAGLARVLAHL
jgi:hypothetical protein